MSRIFFFFPTCLFLMLSARVHAGGFADSPWPMYGRDPGRTHRGAPAPPATNTIKWKLKTEGILASPPVIGENGVIYFGTGDGRFYAVNSDGTIRWKYVGDGPFAGSPAISDSGTVYVCSGATNDGVKAHIYAFGPDGALKWKKMFGADYTSASNPVIGYDGTVYSSAVYNYLYAFDYDGGLQWKYELIGNIPNVWPAVGGSGTIYIAPDGKGLHALNPNGTVKWMLESTVFAGSPVVGRGDTLYIATRNRELCAVGPDGVVVWKYGPPNYSGLFSSAPAIGPDGTIYIGWYDSKEYALYAIDSDGALRWKYPVGRHITQAAAIGGDGCIYVPSDDQYMYAINPDGSMRWRVAFGDPNSVTAETHATATSPVIGGDGTLYFGISYGSLSFGNLCGYLYALAPEKPVQVESGPEAFSLEAPHPNPFNPSTTISFSLPEAAAVALTVHDALGRKVATLVNGPMSAGAHSVTFNGANLASGVYFYRFESAGTTRTGKMLLVK